jgi:phage-related protein (TIGR01555 family)
MSQLLDETNLDIFSVENLAAAFSAGGEAGLRNRVEALAVLKSTYKVVLKDTTEKFERAQISVSGFSEILGMFYGIVAAMADIPVTRFMGTAAKGLNATGEGDMRNYYDMIAAKQVKELKPILAKLDSIIHQDMGHGSKTKWKYSFPSLWQEPETEKESRLLTRSQRDQIYMQAGVVTAEIVAKELRQDKVYSFLDEAHINKVGKLEKEMDEAEHEAMVAGFENAAKGEFSNAGATPAKGGMPSVKPALKTQYDPNDSTKK